MDTHVRTIAKTISWRIAATAMTFGVSYFWLHDVSSSLALALVANFLKTFAYYAHERGWNGLNWGRGMVTDSRVRSVTKSMSWRLIATVVTLGASFFWIDGIKDAASFVGVAMGVKILVYYLHERGWNALGWGKAPVPIVEHSEIYEGSKVAA